MIDEYISKAAVLDTLDRANLMWYFETEGDYQELLKDIKRIPVTDVQPLKHGRWINHRINDEKSLLHGAIKDTTCSECGKSTPYKTDYCMHCGARMDGNVE